MILLPHTHFFFSKKKKMSLHSIFACQHDTKTTPIHTYIYQSSPHTLHYFKTHNPTPHPPKKTNPHPPIFFSKKKKKWVFTIYLHVYMTLRLLPHTHIYTSLHHTHYTTSTHTHIILLPHTHTYKSLDTIYLHFYMTLILLPHTYIYESSHYIYICTWN